MAHSWYCFFYRGYLERFLKAPLAFLKIENRVQKPPSVKMGHPGANFAFPESSIVLKTRAHPAPFSPAKISYRTLPQKT